MASQYQYNVLTQANGDVIPIRIPNDPNGIQAGVPWDDADFQAWNAAQPVPFTLSTDQQAILNAKQMTFAQFATWWAGATQAQQMRLIFNLIKRSLKNEIV